MEYRWITDINQFKSMQAQWDDALLASGEDNPFLLSDFILTWWKYYFYKRRLMVFAVYEHGNIISGIPLYIVRKGARNIIKYVGGAAANLTHSFSLQSEFNLPELLLYALKNDTQWDILILERILGHNSIISQLGQSAASSSNRSVLNCKIYDAGFNGIIDLSKGYRFVLDNLPERLYRYVQSAKAKINKSGQLKLERIRDTNNIRELFSEYRQMSIRSFEMRDNRSAFLDDTYSDFFSELFEVFDSKGILDAHRLTASDKTLAISFGYRFGKGFKWILTAFNPDFYKFKPGYLLIDALLKEAAGNADPYFDMFYGGELFYKRQWCNKMIPLKKAVVYRSSFLNSSFVWLENSLITHRLVRHTAKGIQKVINGIRLKK